MTSLICVVHFGMQALYDEFMRNGLSTLQKLHIQQRDDIMKILEEESSQLSTVVNEIQDKLSKIRINPETNENPVGEMQCCDSSCKDVHVTTDVSPGISPKVCSVHNPKSLLIVSLFHDLDICSQVAAYSLQISKLPNTIWSYLLSMN